MAGTNSASLHFRLPFIPPTSCKNAGNACNLQKKATFAAKIMAVWQSSS
jgi:hypothetical protein